MSCYSQDVSTDGSDSKSLADHEKEPEALCPLLTRITSNKRSPLALPRNSKNKLYFKSQTFSPHSDPLPQSNANFKTELCKNYEMDNPCKWGANCSFALGVHELRNRNQKEELRNK